MKKFICFIIKLLIKLFIIAVFLGLCSVGFILFMSKTNNISVEDTVSYIKSFGNEISSLNISHDNPINIQLNNSSENNVTTIVSANNDNFYYKQLDDNSKLIYNALENNIDNLKKNNYTINFSTQFNNLLNKSNGNHVLNRSFQTAIDAFFYDHPELFYIDSTKISLSIKSITLGLKTKYTVSLIPKNYNYLDDNFKSEEQVNKAISKVENIRNNIISNIPDGSSYTKALKIHDILVNSIEYDSTNSTNSHNIYGALVENTVVCEGYAKAFKYILDALNIESILVSGTATNSSGKTESHMWNYIQLNNKWYGIDVTWDDPIIIGGNKLTQNIIRHDYFCKGRNIFDDNHFVNNKLSDSGSSFRIPILSSKNYK